MYVWCFFLTLFQRNVLKLSKMNEVVISFLYFYWRKRVETVISGCNKCTLREKLWFMNAGFVVVCVYFKSEIFTLYHPESQTFFMYIHNVTEQLYSDSHSVSGPTVETSTLSWYCCRTFTPIYSNVYKGYKGHQNQDRIMLSFVAS